MTITPLPITDRRVLNYWLYLSACHGANVQCERMTAASPQDRRDRWRIKVTGSKSVLPLIEARVRGYADALTETTT